jgi:methylthioribose-1-phosphate isomerase
MRQGIIPTIDYRKGRVLIIDQTLLPGEEKILELVSPVAVAEAIRSLRVRGAPAIGIAAAYGVLIAIEEHLTRVSAGTAGYRFDREEGLVGGEIVGVDPGPLAEVVDESIRMMSETRPTAANLFWALDRMREAAVGSDAAELCRNAAGAAFRIHDDELRLEREIGEHGAPLVEEGCRILTHCNAGGLATAGYGTALAILYTAHREGRRFRVFADETRPLLQGSRLTAWELSRRGIDVTVLCDSAAASLISSERIDMVLVGADRIAANGDVANKIGTLPLAVLCEKFAVPFYVAAPWSTFDTSLQSGAMIPIEERPADEVTRFAGVRTAHEGIGAYNPAFDRTPAGLITAIITEFGVIERPDGGKIACLSDRARR